ncbi:MAG: fatty acyl-AMP ligase [Pseudomonadota bacterium]
MKQVPTCFPTILHALDYHAEVSADAIVLRRLGFRGKAHDLFSFAQLRADALRFAHAISSMTSPYDRVLLAYPSCNDFVVAFLGCLYAGRIAVPVSLGTTGRSGARIAAIMKDCTAGVLVTHEAPNQSLVEAVPDGCQLMAHAALTSQDIQNDLPRPSASDISFLQYTSGSTGHPKGVIVSHGNLAVNLTQILHAIGHTHQRIVSWLPQFHDMGLIGTMLLPVYAGMQTTYMSPLEFVQRPIRWAQALSEFRAHGSVAPNFGFSYLLERLRPGDLDGLDLTSVRTLMCGSEPINAAVLQRFVKRLRPHGLAENVLMPTYGLAEATLMVTAHPRGARVRTRLRGASSKTSPLVACGYPAAGLDLVIRNTEGVVCPEGVEGEITISGPNVCAGYWGHAPHAGPVATGDLGFMCDGELFVTGRKKDIIIVRGRNFYPSDIEAISEACTPRAGANSSAAIGVEVADGSESVMIAQEVPGAAMRDLDADSLRRKISDDILANLGIAPARVLLLRSNALPRTTSGKISRFGLKTALSRGEITDAFLSPTEPEGTLHA